MGRLLGLQKNALCRPRAAKTPSKWSPTWASKTAIYRVQVGTYLGKVLAAHGHPKIDFLRPNLAPCWPHVSRQHETMLDGQHGLMLKANMGSCWCLESKSLCLGNILVRPGNSSVPGEQFCVPREHFCAPGEQFCVPGEQFCVPGNTPVCPGSSPVRLGSNSVCPGNSFVCLGSSCWMTFE